MSEHGSFHHLGIPKETVKHLSTNATTSNLEGMEIQEMDEPERVMRESRSKKFKVSSNKR